MTAEQSEMFKLLTISPRVRVVDTLKPMVGKDHRAAIEAAELGCVAVPEAGAAPVEGGLQLWADLEGGVGALPVLGWAGVGGWALPITDARCVCGQRTAMDKFALVWGRTLESSAQYGYRVVNAQCAVGLVHGEIEGRFEKGRIRPLRAWQDEASPDAYDPDGSIGVVAHVGRQTRVIYAAHWHDTFVLSTDKGWIDMGEAR